MQNCKAYEFIKDDDNPRDKERADSRYQNTCKFKENKDQMISFLKKFLDHFNSIALFSSLKFLV